jgi:hypothetical protein
LNWAWEPAEGENLPLPPDFVEKQNSKQRIKLSKLLPTIKMI